MCDFRCSDQVNQILTRIKQWEGHTEQLQSWVRLKFRQLCNAQQIQFTKVRLMEKQEWKMKHGYDLQFKQIKVDHVPYNKKNM